MKKIALFDSWNLKFSYMFRDHWEEKGYKVHVNPRWEDALDVDLNFFYQADNALIKGTKEVPLKGKVFAQCVDIEVWAGQPFSVDWTKVDGCLFMAKHIERYVRSKMVFPANVKTELIKPGIDTNKFYLRPAELVRADPVRKMVYVVGDNRIWDVKRLDVAFQLLKDAMRYDPDHVWQLHVRGTYSTHEQYNRYCQHLEKDLGISGNVVWHRERVEDLSKWLDDKDYFVLPSTKEAFSYATAEAMSKGIKPILNNWEGAKDTWENYICDTYGEMLTRMLEEKYDREEYRKFVVDRYDIINYLRDIDEFLGI